jgi:apolipoprotein N-acyltransferase
VRGLAIALASLGFALAAFGGPRALATWAAACSPTLLFAPGFPALFAPFGLVPFYVRVLRTRSVAEAAFLGASAGTILVIGAAGWIFHYFDRPLVPSLLAFALVAPCWGSLGAATRALARRPWLGIVPASALVPLIEMLRGEWLDPPLPGLLFAHAASDTALVRLAPRFGEVGISFAVAFVSLAVAMLLRAPHGSRARRLVPIGLAFVGLAAIPLPREPARAGAPVRVCAIADPLRGSREEAFDGGGDTAVFALVDRARELGCTIAVLPEYSVRLAPSQIVAADWGGADRDEDTIVIAGASVGYRDRGDHWLRNVVCRLHLGPGRQINCAGAFDKLVFAPFGEAGLFQDVPILARLGARLSRQATGMKFTRLVSEQPVGSLPIGGGRRAGVAICWELLVPRIFERRGVTRPGDVALLVVVSDLSGFGGSRAAIEHFRRAASVQAVALGAPLVFAATNDPLLVTAAGRLAAPTYQDPFVTAWEIGL